MYIYSTYKMLYLRNFRKSIEHRRHKQDINNTGDFNNVCLVQSLFIIQEICRSKYYVRTCYIFLNEVFFAVNLNDHPRMITKILLHNLIANSTQQLLKKMFIQIS